MPLGKSVIALILSIQILGISILPKMNTTELTKLPNLVQHMTEHVSNGDSDSFLKAFINHYSFNCDHFDPSHQADLPFLSNIQSGFHFLLTQLPDLRLMGFDLLSSTFLMDAIDFPIRKPSSIFHPPAVF
jgi:hypothetical protein